MKTEYLILGWIGWCILTTIFFYMILFPAEIIIDENYYIGKGEEGDVFLLFWTFAGTVLFLYLSIEMIKKLIGRYLSKMKGK